jgi:phage terminase large subunit
MRLNNKQTEALDFLEDDTTEEVLFGGAAGPGKTTLGTYWQLKRRLKYPGTRGFIGRAVMKTLKETTLMTLFEVAKMQGLKRGLHFELTSSQDKEFPNCITFANGSLIFLRDLFLYPSDPDFDELGSLEISDAYIDECSQVVSRAKDILKVRIRYKLNEYNLIPKILYTTNPTKNWAYAEFFKAHQRKELPNHRRFVQAFAWDNPDYPKTSLDSLKNMPEGPEKQRLYHGNWDYSDDPSVLCEYDAIMDMFTNDHVKGNGKKRISSDLAMQGRDKFIIAAWDGLVCSFKVDKGKADGKSIETDIKNVMIHEGVGHSQTVVDSDGMGAYLESYLKGIKEFHGGAQAVHKNEFANLKAECGYKLAEKVNKREIKVICSPMQKEQIIKEMGVLKAKNIDLDESRKRLISKEEMKECLNGKSPDYLDTLLMGMFFHIQPDFVISVA